MHRLIRGPSLFLMLIVVASIWGCGGSTTRLFSKPIAESTYVTYQEWGPNRTVAVMPFVNVSNDKSAHLKVRELFVTALYISGAFKDIVDEGEMLEVMKKLKIRETDPIGKDAIKTLGDNLGVQALIFGVVEEYNERGTKSAQFAISARMVDVETGNILWVGNASMEGGGTIREALGLSAGPPVIDLCRKVIEDLIDDLADEILDRKVKELKTEETARNTGNESAVTKSAEQQPAEQEKRVGAGQPSASGSTAAGMGYTPIVGGN